LPVHGCAARGATGIMTHQKWGGWGDQRTAIKKRTINEAIETNRHRNTHFHIEENLRLEKKKKRKKNENGKVKKLNSYETKCI